MKTSAGNITVRAMSAAIALAALASFLGEGIIWGS